MTMTRQYDKCVFQCDATHCHDTFETGESLFELALILAQEDGWASRKMKSEWLHLCPDCHASETESVFS